MSSADSSYDSDEAISAPNVIINQERCNKSKKIQRRGRILYSVYIIVWSLASLASLDGLDGINGTIT